MVWYFVYSNENIIREGAIYHLFSRLGEYRYEDLDQELRVVLKEKGFSDEMPFEKLIGSSEVLDIAVADTFKEVVVRASKVLDDMLPIPQEDIAKCFLDGSTYGMTPVEHHSALPHFRSEYIDEPCLLISRVQSGVQLQKTSGDETEETVYAIFFLISPEERAAEHQKILSNLSNRIDEKQFIDEWLGADTPQELKEALLHHERFITIQVEKGRKSGDWIDKQLRDIELEEGTLIIFINRNGQLITPSGKTYVREGDRMTITGEPKAIKSMARRYFSDNRDNLEDT
jgi:mannitol/fructose-specific phosphotransferase system IIA component (Ntr-type)